MLDYGSLRNVFKSTARINSEHLVIAEWNMNKYQTIQKYGVYASIPPHATTYNPDDSKITTGENYLLYDDGSTKAPKDQEYFSELSSVFKPNRPDPGIVLMQKYSNNLITNNASKLRGANVNPNQARYYAFSEFREYDYYNSAKNFVTDTGFTRNGGISNADTGVFGGVSPFVVYEDSFPCNKITIKVQNHISIPVDFTIEVLQGTQWVEAYRRTQSSSADFTTGELNIYYNPSFGTWTKVLPNSNIGTYVVEDIESIGSINPTEFKNIRGIRFTVYKMSIVTVSYKDEQNKQITTKHPATLELIEISPRLEVNLSPFTEAFSFDSSIGDNTNFGLPVGAIVSSTGNLSLSNEDGVFLYSSKLSELNMLSPDVKFMFYQIVNDGIEDKAIPLKVLYSNRWNISEDYSVSIDLEDGFKFLRETSAPDLLLHSNTGQRLSVILLFLLDNCGITGLQFKKTDNNSDAEDIFIRSFFSKKEQTLAEVLEELAIATQCSMYFDPLGKFNVLTKERLTRKVAKTPSASSTSGTDFWMIFDENYNYGGGFAAERNEIFSYTSNVVSYSETRLNPITDGEIVYHTYGPPKQARTDLFPKNSLNRLTEDTVFPLSLAFANFGYNTDIVWNAADGDDGAMGAANLIRDLPATRLTPLYSDRTFTAFNEEDAVREIYNQADQTKRDAMIIRIDPNEGLTINSFQGTVLIGTEFIKYNGKLFQISSTPNKNNSLQIPVDTYKILFSREEFAQEIRNIGVGGSIKLVGLIVDIQFKVQSQTDGAYVYKVIGDGRAKEGSDAQVHAAVVESQNGLSESLRYGLSLGGKYNANFPTPTISVKHNFLDRVRYKSAYRELEKRNLLSTFASESYLGFLKMVGRSDEKDKSVIDKLYSENPDSNKIANELKEINKQTDDIVPGDFDDFIYLNGERNIYGQKIQLDFSPNIISTRMRPFSPRRRKFNNFFAAETISSIAGLAFGVNKWGEGYYLEVEGIGSGKDDVASESFKNNLRFYKVQLNNGVYEPNLIFSAPVSAYVVQNVDVQVIRSVKGNVDPYFDLTIVIDYPRNGTLARYTIYYGETRVGRFTEIAPTDINKNNISLFVRGDSQAIFEYVSAASRPTGLGDLSLYRKFNAVEDKVKAGLLPINQQYLYKDDSLIVYYNDFAKLVREVKDYDIRFTYPAYASKLIDVSEVNSQYMVKKYNPTPFGAKLLAVNTSPGPILLTEESSNPLYIVAVPMQELSSGTINMESFFDEIDEKKRKIIDREKNKSIFGSQSFTIDSQYLQTISQARAMMRWIIKFCSRPRIQLNMEIFSNPLLELGDKVKIYDKSRGYNEDNPRFGDKTFIVSSISHAIDNTGPTMNVELIEVGAA